MPDILMYQIINYPNFNIRFNQGQTKKDSIPNLDSNISTAYSYS